MESRKDFKPLNCSYCREGKSCKRMHPVNSRTDAQSFHALFYLANEVMISTKRSYPTLRKGTLLLSKYEQEGFALIQDIVSPATGTHISCVVNNGQDASVLCRVGRLHCNRRRRRKKGNNTSVFEGISNLSSLGGQQNCP